MGISPRQIIQTGTFLPLLWKIISWTLSQGFAGSSCLQNLNLGLLYKTVGYCILYKCTHYALVHCSILRHNQYLKPPLWMSYMELLQPVSTGWTFKLRRKKKKKNPPKSKGNQCGGNGDLFLKKALHWGYFTDPLGGDAPCPFFNEISPSLLWWLQAGVDHECGRKHLTVKPIDSNCFYKYNGEHCRACGIFLQQLYHVRPSLETTSWSWVQALWGTTFSLWLKPKAAS